MKDITNRFVPWLLLWIQVRDLKLKRTDECLSPLKVHLGAGYLMATLILFTALMLLFIHLMNESYKLELPPHY
ncbi:MAG: hypothetical protein CMN98_07560 [Synechococcus sp. NP17]|nr:hypothetical protein [Synechococcus sp. NP17]